MKLREEIHANHLLHKPGPLARIEKHKRLLLLRDAIDFEATLPDINVLNVIVDKANKPPGYDVFERAWMTLLQRFENTISHRNIPGSSNTQDYGIVIADPSATRLVRMEFEWDLGQVAEITRQPYWAVRRTWTYL